ncbi:ATP-dependent DNA helicase PIF1 [Hirsutella rhossiliensis]
MKRNSLKICSRCIGRDRKKAPNEPYFFSAANHLDFGEIPANLPDLTMVEEMLIARVHVHVKVLQVRGAQYKYRGHVVHFLRNVGRLFEELPVLAEELDIVLLRPPNIGGDPRFQQQFARDFRRHHPGYRDIVVPQGPVEEVVEEDPSEPDASAIPNLQITDTELNALQSRFLDGTPNPGTPNPGTPNPGRIIGLEYMPRSAQTHHQMPLPSIRRTPIDEFNRSQPLLSLAFPTLYPDGKADFVEPRLRSITYQDYLGHAMRWHDGRFARHKTWPFVALNTMLQEAMAEPDEPEAQALIQSITRQAAELEAYAYNLGKPGLFATASAADYHWESLYRHMPRFDEWQTAPEVARMALSRQLLRDNAHIAAYHFHKRYTLFRTIVLKQKFNLTDSWGRYEWQGRGSSHHHGLYWLSGHPDLDPDNDQSRERFARIWGYHVSAVNPEPQRIQAPGEGNPLIGNLLEHPLTVQLLSMVLNRVQRHRCNNYCMQLNKHTKLVECRFGFPHGHRLLASLDRVPHSKHWSFRGERNDGQINHYNRLLTVAWLANTDVSPCTSLQQVIDYAAKYCSKSEKKSESFAQIGKALMPRVKDHNPLISFTSKLLNQLVAERDYSKQEVCHLLLGLPLQEGHSRSLRIDGDEVDEAPNIYEKYIQRPEALKDLTYVSFLKYWNFRTRDPSKWKQWQPGNINGRPRQQWPDYCRAFSYCWRHHSHGDDHYGRPKDAPLQPKDDQYEALPVEEEFDDEDWIRLAALLPGNPLTQEDLDLLGRRDIDVNYDWTRHPPHGQRCGVGGTFTDLSPADAAALQSRLRHVKYLVIDEKSMLGLEQLARVDSRLRQAFPQRSFEFFGGRQAGDDQAQFRQALQELREVKLSIPSWNLLSSRVQARLTQSEVDSFRTALRVYSTKARVEANNQGKGAGQAPSDNAGNLSNKFPVAKGTRVMLTTNLWQPAGLVNGALGTVYDIAWNAGADPLEDPPSVIMVDFDSYDGPPYLTTNEGRKISPILPSLTKDQIVTDLATRDFQAGISYVAVSRVTSLQGLLLEAPFDRQSLYNHTPTEGMKMRLADQQRRQAQQLTDPLYPPLYRD